MTESSTKPYLIRAIHEWCCDNGFRPYVAVAVDARTVVPREFVRNGEIVLNVSVDATNRLRLGNDLIEFEARFGGTARQVSIPIDCVTAIYAAENGHGMAFEVPKAEAVVDDAPSSPAEGRAADPRERAPSLEVVPTAADPAERSAPGAPGAEDAAPGPRFEQGAESAPVADTPAEPPSPPGSGGRPRLTRIK